MEKKTFELPTDEKGAVFIPDELLPNFQPAIDRLTAKRINDVRTEAQKEIDALKKSAANPADLERLRQLEEKEKARAIEDEEKAKNYKEALALKDKDITEKLGAKDQEIKRHRDALQSGLRAEIRAAAAKSGARDESIAELEQLLIGRLDLDKDFAVIVKGADGQPAVDAEKKPLTVEGMVSTYLDANPHHRKAAGGTGGGARGGASLHTNLPPAARAAYDKVVAAQKRLDDGDRSDQAITDLFEANRELTRAKAGVK